MTPASQMGLVARKPVFGACEQQRRSLISAFVIRFLQSIISKLATSKISNFYLVSVPEETGYQHALSKTPKTSILATRPKCIHFIVGVLFCIFQARS